MESSKGESSKGENSKGDSGGIDGAEDDQVMAVAIPDLMQFLNAYYIRCAEKAVEKSTKKKKVKLKSESGGVGQIDGTTPAIVKFPITDADAELCDSINWILIGKTNPEFLACVEAIPTSEAGKLARDELIQVFFPNKIDCVGLHFQNSYLCVFSMLRLS